MTEPTENTEATEAQSGSIIPEKYRESMRGPGDWLKQMITSLCSVPMVKDVEVKDEDGNVTGTETKTLKGSSFHMDKFFQLAEVNHLDVEKYRADVDKKNAPGRLRMTIGNMLRAAARKRGGLYDLDDNWVEAPEDFMGDRAVTHNRDGSKIPVAKPEPEAENAEADAA